MDWRERVMVEHPALVRLRHSAVKVRRVGADPKGSANGSGLTFLPGREEVIGDAEAAALLVKCDYRRPWDRNAA